MASTSYIRNSTAAAQRKRKKPRPPTAKPGINYIRDATKRQETAAAPKPPPRLVGIDYIRNNTKREVDARQKAANAAARAAKPTAATPQGGAPGVSGNGNAASYVDTIAPIPSAAKKAKKTKAPKAPAAPATPAAAEENPIDALYNAAGRQLDKQERAAQLQLEARLADQKAFDEYVMRVRTQANTTLGEQFKESAANANKARTDSLATVQGYADQAIAAAGGNQNVLDAAGVNANMASNAFNVGATGMDSADTAANQQTLTEYQTGQSNMDLARSANMRSEAEADRRATMSEIAQRRFDLSQESAKAKIEQENADRQFQLDSIVADYLNQQRMSETEIARYNAETERLGTRTPEERAAELALERDRVAAQNARDLAAAQKDSSTRVTEYAEQLNKWYGDEMDRRGITGVDDITDPQGRIEVGRSAIAQLRSIDKNISVEDAYVMLRGVLPPHVINDNRIKQEIARYFK